MQHRQPSPRGYGTGEDRGGQAHVAEVILCDMGGMALLSHSLPYGAISSVRGEIAR